MANLMITTACNFRCDYCFGRDMIGPGHPAQTMTWEIFLSLMDWIDRGHRPELDIHLMGGEPTLSPLFGDMFTHIRERGRPVKVFSNASVPLPDKVIAKSVDLEVEWIVNTNPPATYSEENLAVLKRHLKALGRQAMLTFNLAGGDVPYRYIFEYIDEFDLRPCLKLGVALPTMRKNNVYVSRDIFPSVADRVLEVFRTARQKGVEVEFECGVPYCLFTGAEHRDLTGISLSHCDSRLDITPAGEVINCLPLCRMAAPHYTRFTDYDQAIEWFRRALKPYFSLGVGEECLGCVHLREGRCRACLAYGLEDYNRLVLPPLPG